MGIKGNKWVIEGNSGVSNIGTIVKQHKYLILAGLSPSRWLVFKKRNCLPNV